MGALRPARQAAALRRLALAWVVASGLAACSEGGTPPEPPGTPGLRVVSGGGASDTIGATLTQALVVELRDASGYIRAGAEVVFRVVPSAGIPTPDDPRVAKLSSSQFTGIVAETSDAQGRSAVLVQFGRSAGPAEIAITAPSLGMQTSATFTVRPGAAARVVVAPADSAAVVGGGYELRGVVHDRAGNARPDPIVYTAGNAAVSVSGATLRGERVGRGRVVATAGGIADTAWVSVVPAGVLAAYEFPVFFNSNGPDIRQPGRIVTLNTDGSAYRVVLDEQPARIPTSYARGMQPSWSPDGTELSFLLEGRVMVTSLAGLARPLYAEAPPAHDEFAPQFSPAGEWIYFSRGFLGSQHTVWRVRRDGTGLVQVSPPEDWGIEVMGSPDPTGNRVVFQTNRATNSPVDFTIRILDIDTGEVAALDVPGSSPRWSPRGDWIAFLGRDGRLRRVRPDGTGMRTIGSGIGAHPTFAWSPDGDWLVISGNQARPDTAFGVGLFLVEVESGEVLPLAFGRSLVQPTWRR
jgi:Tol biopolymer transport system component